METIVKGKVVEIKYVEPLYSIDDNVNYEDIFFDMISEFENRIEYLKDKLNKPSPNEIIVVKDWKEIFRSNKIEFRLNIGEYFNIDNQSYKIEKIDGTNENEIIYYIDKIIEETEDKDSLRKVHQEHNSSIISKIFTLQNSIIKLKIKEEVKKQTKTKRKWLGLFKKLKY